VLGQSLGHFEIREPLGSGGMGDVYRAFDTRLGRDVAVKVLPEAFAADAEMLTRLNREAHLLASLNHPNIATIHSLEEVDGIRFLVLELVPGESLQRLLEKGPLPLERALLLCGQIAEALEAAHREGIIHRDLKPANVLVTPEGVAKVLDFGIAKSTPAGETGTETAKATDLTTIGTLIGTVPYMSPEQIRGEAASARSDIWAFGCVAFQVLTGRPAFARETAADTLAAIVECEPDWKALPVGTPDAVRTLVQRCLRKDPERRLHDIADARADLQDVLTVGAPAVHTGGTGGGAARSMGGLVTEPGRARRVAPAPALVAVATLIVAVAAVAWVATRWPFDSAPVPGSLKVDSLAVLPFANQMNDPEQDYFVEGMHEALISDLAKIGDLRVISRTSAMRYRDSDKSLREIAAELGADVLVEGSVLRSGLQVRISAQLIDGRTDEYIWGQSYDRNLEDVLFLLRDVARAIAAEVEITLTPRQEQLLTSAGPVNPAAHEAYLRGQHQMNNGTMAGFREALPFYQRAVALEPSFAQAWAGLAGDYFVHGFFDLAPRAEVVPESRRAVTEALRLDRRLGPAHSVLGSIALYFDWDWETAEREFELALELDPTDWFTRHGYADYLAVTGDCEGSVEQMLIGRQYDPMGIWSHRTAVAHLTMCGQYDRAVEEGLRMVELFPQQAGVHDNLGSALWNAGRYQEALAEYRLAWGADSTRLQLMEAGFAEGGPQAAMLAAATYLVSVADAGSPNPFGVAVYFAAGGDADRAFEWLDRALQARTPQLLHLRIHPAFDSLRSDPRYAELTERIGFP